MKEIKKPGNLEKPGNIRSLLGRRQLKFYKIYQVSFTK